MLGSYYCPHHTEGTVIEFAMDCGCRKPADGMLRRAAAELDIDLDSSFMVGDILDDIEAYNRDDCISTLYLRKWLEERRAEAVASGVEVPRPPVPARPPESALPKEDENAFDAWLAADRRTELDVEQLARAARRGDVHAVRAAVAQASADDARSSRLANALGLSICGTRRTG